MLLGTPFGFCLTARVEMACCTVWLKRFSWMSIWTEVTRSGNSGSASACSKSRPFLMPSDAERKGEGEGGT